MTLSTCILTLAIVLVCSTSIPSSCFLPRVNAGILTVAQYNPTEAWISNPRSANIVSPGRRLFKRLEFSVMCLSLALPPHPSDIKLTLPCGVIPIKYLTVLWCLYDEYVWALARRSDSLSMKISKQSIMTTHSGQFFLKSIGKVLRNTSLSGHTIKNFNRMYNISITLANIRETVEGWMPKWYPSWTPEIDNRNRINVSMSCWNGVSDRWPPRYGLTNSKSFQRISQLVNPVKKTNFVIVISEAIFIICSKFQPFFHFLLLSHSLWIIHQQFCTLCP